MLGDLFWELILSKMEFLSLVTIFYKHGFKVKAFNFATLNNMANGYVALDKPINYKCSKEVNHFIHSISENNLLYRFFLCIGYLIINSITCLFNFITRRKYV